MLEKLTTHDIQDVSALFSLADKCAKAAEGHAWHSPFTQVAKGESKPNAETQAQGGGNGNNNNNKKKKKKTDGNQPLPRAPTAAAVAVGGGRGGPRGKKRPRQLSNSDDACMMFPVHNSTRHTASKCREIKKLAENFRDKMQHQCQDGAPSHQWKGKQKVDSREEKDVEIEF
jgi:hypothetical protein